MIKSVIRIRPLQYIHVLDNNTNCTRVEVGPQTFTRQEHEHIITDPQDMIVVPPRMYCVIDNPVLRDDAGKVMLDANGNYRLRHGDQEVRLHGPPFPLYPGEVLSSTVAALRVVVENDALRLKCLREFSDEKGVHRVPGEEWLWYGPGTYVPRVEEAVEDVVRATLVPEGDALRLCARRDFVKAGVKRYAGEEWLERVKGLYLPDVNEIVREVVSPTLLTDSHAIHLKSVKTHKDVFGVERKAGSEWLVTVKDTHLYIPDVSEQLVGVVQITTLTNRQYAVVLNPVVDGATKYGERELRKGPQSFFLRPGEELSGGIQTIMTLGEDQALLLRAREAFRDDEGVNHHPGDRWMICGPREYVCPVQAEVVEERRKIALDENEGIYVRDITTGRVRAHVGSSYMLTANEELWQKTLPDSIEQLLQQYGSFQGKRDPTRVVTLRAPNNTAVQIYDYREKCARVVFGPDLILLGPDEHFTLINLSGDKPKRPYCVKDLCLQLGPEFSTDLLTVETADHARLQMQLSYSWHFDVDRSNAAAAARLFSVPDFIGDFCKAVASRVRGVVAQNSFDEFHRSSARIIRSAVFGVDADGRVNERFVFTANNLVITNVDIQSVEPVDQRTRDSLQKSVQQAIEITTKSQEAAARHLAERDEQLARGRLERQKISDEVEAEQGRAALIKLAAQCSVLESTGQAQAEAHGKAEAAKIEGEVAVRLAKLKVELMKIQSEVELSTRRELERAEQTHRVEMDKLELAHAAEMSEIEARKFQSMVAAIGPETLAAISRAGPEMQARLLEGLGVQSFLITDGSSPINLFNAAEGLIQRPESQVAAVTAASSQRR